MATLTLGLTSGPATGSKSYTLSDADVSRWLNALRTLEANKDPSLTNAQILARWADSVVAQAKGLVHRVEREAAEKAARASITDIGIS